MTLKGGEYFFSPSITFLRNLPTIEFEKEEPASVEDVTEAPVENVKKVEIVE